MKLTFCQLVDLKIYSNFYRDYLILPNAALPRIFMDELRKLFIENTLLSASYHEKLAKKYLDRSVRHILLLHEIDLVALFLVDMVKALRAEGWTIISPVRAYKDPLNQFRIKEVLPFNPGRVGEVALENGVERRLSWAPNNNTAQLTCEFNRRVLGRGEP